MPVNTIQNDVAHLAGQFPHRGANTESERAAAEYLRARLLEFTPNAEIDDFYSPDRPWYLFASYYAEFALVGLIAAWKPAVAAVYATVVFLTYFAEYMGYHILGRFLPHYETQNVLARYLNPRADRNIVFMAHYDSVKFSPLSEPRWRVWANHAQIVIVFLMLVVIASCAVEAYIQDTEAVTEILLVRWLSIIGLLAAAAVFGVNEWQSDFTEGANDNASGTAALLHIAETLRGEPLKNCNVYFAATGSNQNWMSGARHFIKYHGLDRNATYWINLDKVGRGILRYTIRMGILHVHPCAPQLVAAAQVVARQYNALPAILRTSDSDALIVLARGNKAIEITAAGPEIDTEDSPARIDPALIERAADFAIAIARQITDKGNRA